MLKQLHGRIPAGFPVAFAIWSREHDCFLPCNVRLIKKGFAWDPCQHSMMRNVPPKLYSTIADAENALHKIPAKVRNPCKLEIMQLEIKLNGLVK